MALCRIEGLDELIDDMERHYEEAEEVFDELLETGAEECKEAWRRAALKHGHMDTGDMIAAVNYSIKPRHSSGIREAHIYPIGKDKRGIRHASKAFWRHYGTSKKAGTYWVDTADEEVAKIVPDKLLEIWNKHLSKKG